MEIKFIAEAYKPAEKLVFDYILIKSVLSKVLKEQKFTLELDNMLLVMYKKFASNLSELLDLYKQTQNSLSLSELTLDSREEVDSVLEDCGLSVPLLPEEESVPALTKLLVSLNTLYLEEASKYKDAIPGFTWDIDSFKDAFKQIQEKGERYANEQIRSSETRI